ncbi:hypothetical protein TNCV_777301 [Trichonephila clavipes]|nr:hypothetical protein TNCV_777301 [Trichonephila clavipes]
MAEARPANRPSLARFAARYPVVWRGNLALKDARATVMMHFLSGNVRFARSVLPQDEFDPTPMKITHQRRLMPEALKEVIQAIKIHENHSILLAIPCGTTRDAVNRQRRSFRQDILNYLRSKDCMGIVNGADPETKQPAYVMKIFPQCEFANSLLLDMPILPDTRRHIFLFAHSLVVLQKV